MQRSSRREARRQGGRQSWLVAHPGRVAAGPGVLWLIAGALKFKPGLADRGQEAYSFAMTAMGAPAPVAREIVRVGRLLVGHPRLWWAIGVVEVAIGVGLLVRRCERAALVASVVWGLGIWVLGEGFEGLSAGATSIATGFPGATVLYALVAVLVWPTKPTDARSVAAASPLRGAGAKATWALLWLTAAAVQLRSQGGPGGLDSTLFMDAREEPGLLAGLDRWELRWLTFGHEVLLSTVLAVFCVLVTLTVVLDVVPRLPWGPSWWSASFSGSSART